MTSTPDPGALDTLCINTIRALAMDAVEKANSGHPGAPMGLAPAGYVLFTRLMKHHPQKPDWLDRDRFVLSGGHASALLYSLLHLTGYPLCLDDLKAFRQWGSLTPGHPEHGHTPGVETTTGPLGQGFANAVGLAMAERHLAARFNQPGFAIVDHFTYVMCGDGDLMEGVAAEAASLAGHLKLGRLICLYDDNGISIEGATAITFTEDVAKRFAAYGWQVIRVAEGNDPELIFKAVKKAKADRNRPSLVIVKTQIAHGSPNKQGSHEAHGAPLGKQEVCLTKECLGLPADEFCIPQAVFDHCRGCVERGRKAEARWLRQFKAYTKAHPQLADDFVSAMSAFLPKGWDENLPVFTPDQPAVATRVASGKTLQVLARRLPTLMGGSADLAPSNNTFIKDVAEFQAGSYGGRNIRFGVREHAMGAILNGMILHNGIRPYGGTFLVFADYMRPAIRLAALMKLPVIYVFTHDSVAVGEDGPTHQPVEHVASLRAIPNLTVIRPADANETVAAWRTAIKATSGPVALILSRQNLPVLEPGPTCNLAQGAYVVADAKGQPDLILMASGSEVSLAMAAGKRLEQEGVGVRVVSMPSWELFEAAAADYRRQVLPPAVTARVAIEAGIAMGWKQYVGERGAVLGIDRFGASAPGPVVMEKLGFTVDALVDLARKVMKK